MNDLDDEDEVDDVLQVKEKQAIPIGQIDLPVTLGNPSNYRTETLTFEGVGFPPVITVGTSFYRAYECEVESCELVLATLASEELAAIEKDIAEGAPDAKRAARSVEPTENVKEVLIDLDNSVDKTVRIDTTLSPK
ncbi:uncharacterized protein [Miscanthus floridulus]|uniref:uncharacterized protein n=1 Tax=Miscanthus floridulus TaxID=154761 RepID=UPI00345955E0